MKMIKQFPARSGLLLLLVFFVVSIWLVFEYVDTERQRDLAGWQSRLGMLVDLRRSAVENELHTRRELLREFAENPSLQLYLAQYSSTQNRDDMILAAQLSHVRNLLAATGERFGFDLRHAGSVNLEPVSEYGIAVTDADGKLLVASKGFSQNMAALGAPVSQVLQNGVMNPVDLFAGESGNPVYGFVMPVFHVQRMQSRQAIGAVIVLLDPRQGLFRQLENNHLDTASDETLLLRRHENNLLFISPLQKDFALFYQLAAGAQLAEASSLQQTGAFIHGTDYRGHEVLATARAVSNTSWFIVQKIDAAEALAESDQHQRFLLTSLLLLTGLISASFIAIWHHGTSVRLQHLTASLEAQTALLNAVSDNIHEIIFLLDEKYHFIFVNLSLAKILSIAPADAAGKNLASVLGPDIAGKLQNLQCNHDRGSERCVVNLPLGNSKPATSTYHVSSVVLSQGPYQNATLFVLHDLSELKAAEEKRDRLAQGIIGTLVKAVDLHDPFCVDHSARTREVAMCIASELHLDRSRCEALDMAALLANIGKLFLPREMLTKMDALSDAENELLKKHIDYAVDILRQLEFEGPVVEIIAQKNECLDGSGYPQGLRADAILVESRILAVANAFVAMASARAYREGRPIKEVLDILLQQSGQRYDRHVVAALFHIAENKTDWRNWQAAKPLAGRD
ncbi:MAG: hypothetical protein QG652_822 [Pseudomonadota bacterium]|nr:hypothetical protein [Pseudomonadota bacterium]